MRPRHRQAPCVPHLRQESQIVSDVACVGLKKNGLALPKQLTAGAANPGGLLRGVPLWGVQQIQLECQDGLGSCKVLSGRRETAHDLQSDIEHVFAERVLIKTPL